MGVGFGAEAAAPHFVAHDALHIRVRRDLSSMTELSAASHPKARRRYVVGAIALCGALVVLGGVYGIARLRSNPERAAAGACESAVETAADRIAPLAHGEVAALAVAHTAFRGPRSRLQGRRRPRADAWQTGAAAPCCSISGRPGACPAARKCRRSTRLQAELGGQDFEVRRHQYRHPRSAKATQFPQGETASPTSPIIPIRAQRCFRTSSLPARLSACRRR